MTILLFYIVCKHDLLYNIEHNIYDGILRLKDFFWKNIEDIQNPTSYDDDDDETNKKTFGIECVDKNINTKQDIILFIHILPRLIHSSNPRPGHFRVQSGLSWRKERLVPMMMKMSWVS